MMNSLAGQAHQKSCYIATLSILQPSIIKQFCFKRMLLLTLYYQVAYHISLHDMQHRQQSVPMAFMTLCHTHPTTSQLQRHAAYTLPLSQLSSIGQQHMRLTTIQKL